MRDFGSLLAFTLRFTYLAIAQMQGFSLANSLIKKLYSVEENRNEDDDDVDKNDMMASIAEDDKDKVRQEIENRSTFSY